MKGLPRTTSDRTVMQVVLAYGAVNPHLFFLGGGFTLKNFSFLKFHSNNYLFSLPRFVVCWL